MSGEQDKTRLEIQNARLKERLSRMRKGVLAFVKDTDCYDLFQQGKATEGCNYCELIAATLGKEPKQ